MGLAPYGNPEADQVTALAGADPRATGRHARDGSLLLNMDYFDYATGLNMCHDDKWEALFGCRTGPGRTTFDQRYMDLALAIQQVTEEIVLRLAETARKLTGQRKSGAWPAAWP